MSFLSKFFKNKPSADRGKLLLPNPEWEYYFSDVNDERGSIFVDLSLQKIAPVTNKPNLVWISIKMNKPRPDGLSSREEFETLKALEDVIANEFSTKCDAIFSGRLTTNGYRDFYFYLSNTLLYEKTISTAMRHFEDYTFTCGIKEDADWRFYVDFLYPLPQQMQSILNRRVIEQLEKNGDSLKKERQVDHWIFFKTEQDRKDFIYKIKDDGFNIVGEIEITDAEKDALDDHPYQLQISRIDKVDHSSVDDYVLYLWQLAKDCNGDYDGWETSVEAD